MRVCVTGGAGYAGADFSRIRDELGFVPRATVADGVDELIAALQAGRFDDPEAACYANG